MSRFNLVRDRLCQCAPALSWHGKIHFFRLLSTFFELGKKQGVNIARHLLAASSGSSRDDTTALNLRALSLEPYSAL